MYIGIKRFMEEYITDKAVNGIKCHYDMWKDVSPLWLGKLCIMMMSCFIFDF